MTVSKRTSSCCCGAIAVEASGEPVVSAICHCADCRRRTGSAFGWSAYFPQAAVSVTCGVPREYRPVGADFLPRQFCSACGSTLSWRDYRMPGLIGLAAGALDPAVGPPTMSNQDADRCAWLALPAECADRT